MQLSEHVYIFQDKSFFSECRYLQYTKDLGPFWLCYNYKDNSKIPGHMQLSADLNSEPREVFFYCYYILTNPLQHRTALLTILEGCLKYRN